MQDEPLQPTATGRMPRTENLAFGQTRGISEANMNPRMRGNPMRYNTRFTCYRTRDDLAAAIARNQPALNAATEAWLTAKREHGSGSPQEMALWP